MRATRVPLPDKFVPNGDCKPAGFCDGGKLLNRKYLDEIQKSSQAAGAKFQPLITS
jgi:hypothetical protein